MPPILLALIIANLFDLKHLSENKRKRISVLRIVKFHWGRLRFDKSVLQKPKHCPEIPMISSTHPNTGTGWCLDELIME